MKLNPNKIIDLYWFSGSGNTLFIAKVLADFLVEKGYKVNLRKIENANPMLVDLNRTLGLAFPVAEQGTYPFVWDFIRNLPAPSEQDINNSDVFMVDTLMLYSGGIKGPVKKILKDKGFNLLGAKEIIMPNILMKMKNQSEKDKLKMDRGAATAKQFALDLIEGKAVWKDIPLYSDMMGSFSKMDSTWNMLRKNFPLKVKNNLCTRCRLCERICPVQSWTYDKNSNEMTWENSDCIFCLRCFSYCPAEAITYGKKNYLHHKALKAVEFSATKYSQQE